jgi:hypothetical protein
VDARPGPCNCCMAGGQLAPPETLPEDTGVATVAGRTAVWHCQRAVPATGASWTAVCHKAGGGRGQWQALGLPGQQSSPRQEGPEGSACHWGCLDSSPAQGRRGQRALAASGDGGHPRGRHCEGLQACCVLTHRMNGGQMRVGAPVGRPPRLCKAVGGWGQLQHGLPSPWLGVQACWWRFPAPVCQSRAKFGHPIRHRPGGPTPRPSPLLATPTPPGSVIGDSHLGWKAVGGGLGALNWGRPRARPSLGGSEAWALPLGGGGLAWWSACKRASCDGGWQAWQGGGGSEPGVEPHVSHVPLLISSGSAL